MYEPPIIEPRQICLTPFLLLFLHPFSLFTYGCFALFYSLQMTSSTKKDEAMVLFPDHSYSMNHLNHSVKQPIDGEKKSELVSCVY